MGYRSKVVISLKRKDFDVLSKRFEEELKDKFEEEQKQYDRIGLKEKVPNLMKNFDTFVVKKADKEENDIIVFGWDWIKWHEKAFDVKFILKFLHELDENTPYKLVCVGEDNYTEEEENYDCEDDSCDIISAYCDIAIEDN